MEIHEISAAHLSIENVNRILACDAKITLSEDAKNRINTCRAFLDKKLSSTDELLYGINTGFGSLCNIKIDNHQLEQLQTNLVLSHACGVGEPVPEDIVKLMLLLKIQSLSYGFSGIRLVVVERLVAFYNLSLTPLIFQKGSLGASGDLAPLAHLSLPLIGEGHFYINGKKRESSEVLKENNITPLNLAAKEGLALLNGTQFMSAYGVYNIIKSKQLSHAADVCTALSADAFDCKKEPFLPYIHAIRPHTGQVETAKNILDLLEGSEIASQTKNQTQDPYAFRCVPQVHGATKGALAHIEAVFETEINSVTDNP
ncbi:MAG: aromatic amino acid ammonia-lyase, partial [Bacteroidetes bacterium]|nr:aromatic amino acid ammonia-lyase [Bacteroidota bacterium]